MPVWLYHEIAPTSPFYAPIAFFIVQIDHRLKRRSKGYLLIYDIIIYLN